MVENETHCKLQTLCTDRGGEYMSGAFKDFLGKKDIKHQCTMPYTPQQNGVVERKNRSLMEMDRCMLKAKSLPHKLWMEAVACAAHVLNKFPTCALKTITPYEARYDRKPSVSYLCVFGCLAYAYIPQQLRGKLDDKTQDVFEDLLPSFVEKQESQKVDNLDQYFDQHVKPHDVEEIVREEQEVLREERILPKWEEVYVSQPSGFVVKGQEQKAMEGFQYSPTQSILYVKKRNGVLIMLTLYVDDMLLTGNNENEIAAFKDALRKTFEMFDLGLLHYYLVIQFVQSEDGIYMF
ncbi:hypothetical protein L7F22_053233 [Adiantum nelumboides]|nr:hypothetical protein [Adiantum nelumboides]